MPWDMKGVKPNLINIYINCPTGNWTGVASEQCSSHYSLIWYKIHGKGYIYENIYRLKCWSVSKARDIIHDIYFFLHVYSCWCSVKTYTKILFLMILNRYCFYIKVSSIMLSGKHTTHVLHYCTNVYLLFVIYLHYYCDSATYWQEVR